jgi:hypothetical protein
MASDDDRLFQQVHEVIEAAIKDLAKANVNREALRRLETSEDARQAWRKLAKKVGEKFDETLVLNIVGPAASAYRDDSERRTAAEIQEAYQQATKLAEGLIELIERHASLQTHGSTTLPIIGLGEYFEYNSDELKMCLMNLSAFAKYSANLPNEVNRPNQEFADHRAFALGLSFKLNNFHGQPLHEVVAGFTSAVFDEPIDTELVKKWWGRADKSTIFPGLK